MRTVDTPPWGEWLRTAVLTATVVAMAWLLLTVDLPAWPQLREQIGSYGWASWLVFVGLYALVAVTPIPVTVMAVAGGALFGWLPGLVLSMIGVVTGSCLGYGLARLLGRQTVARLLGRYAETITTRLRADDGVLAMSMLRLMPGVPYWPVNYGAGAFGARLRPFLTSTLAGSLPGQASLVAIGAVLDAPSALTVTILVLSWLTVLALTALTWRRWRAERTGHG